MARSSRRFGALVALLLALTFLPAGARDLIAPVGEAAGICDPIDPRGVPPPVAERLLHRRRPEHRHGEAFEPEPARDAAQRRRHPDRPDRLQPQRRVLARRADRHEGARARHAGGARAHEPRRPDRPRPLRGSGGAGRRARRVDRSSGIRSGSSSTARTPPRELAAARRHHAPRASGGQLRRGPPLHRRASVPQGRDRRAYRARRRRSPRSRTGPARRRARRR